MNILRIALCLWASIYCFSFYDGVVSLVVVLLGAGFLALLHTRKYALLYLFACLLVLFRMQLPSVPPTELTGRVIGIRPTYVIVALKDQKVMVANVPTTLQLNYDDRIEFTGTYQKITGFQNFGLFDYAKYRQRQRIHYQLYADAVQVVQPGKTMRSFFYHHVQAQAEPFRSIANRILFGQAFEEETTLAATMLSSGMHLSTLITWLERLASFFVVEQVLPYLSLAFPLLWIGCFGMQLTLLRILGTRLLRLVKTSKQSKLGLLMVGLLLLDPYHGFQLGFVIPMTLRLLLLFRHRAFPIMLYRTFVLFPILLCTNFTYSLFQVILFPLFRNLFAALYGSCLLALLLSFFQPFAIFWYQFLLDKLEQTAIVQSWAVTMRVPLLFVLLWLLFLSLLQTNPKKYGIGMAILLICQGLLVFGKPVATVTFLDVGQGDATLISLPFHQGHILIDTGGNVSLDIAEMVLIPYFRSKGITSLDLVILTHEDFDHSGALPSLQEQFPIKQVLRTKEEVCGVDRKQEPIHFMKQIAIQFLLCENTYDNANDNGLIAYLKLGDTKLLFMGDVGIAVEQDLMRKYEFLVSDVLHIGHHGSNTSSGAAFLGQVDPSLAIISSGKNNRYRHPHPDVMARLHKLNIHALNTQTDGSISLYLSKTFNFYHTYLNSSGIMISVIL